MTDRIDRLIVILEEDIRDDDVQAFADVIQNMRGVLRVELGVRDISSLITGEERERSRIRGMLFGLLREIGA